MNWFFWFLVVIGAVFLWFICSFGYKPIGKFFYKIYKDARDIIAGKEENKERKEEDK